MRSVRIRLVEFIISVAMELGVASDPGGSNQVCLSCALFGVRPRFEIDFFIRSGC